MKQIIWILIYIACTQTSFCQYYLRGEIKDERGRVLEGVKINLQSKGAFPYYSGNSGNFGISVSVPTDTISFQLDGYEMFRTSVDTRKFQVYTLKMLPSTAQLYTGKLSSATTNLKSSYTGSFSVLGESYSTLIENDFIHAADYPETGFAMNTDKASYSNIRRFLNNGMYVPTDAIRVEEMLHYFQLNQSQSSRSNHQFSLVEQLSDCPWNKENKLLFLQLDAPKLNLDSLPPSNLVFLIDISGSMDKPNRLPLLQTAFKMLVDNLREKDTISLITYGGGVGIALAPTGGNEKKKIKSVIDSLVASGDTPGAGAIRIAYEIAKKKYNKQGNNRVILATDGDFNVGQTNEKELEDLIISYKQTGIYLTCLGVGMGNYKDSKLEALAKKGNGNFAYIDQIQEAEKILVKEFTQTMYAVANNAYLKINFNPSVVKDYRLIGYENKKHVVMDSTSELEGGEVGSGQNIISLFEIKTQRNDSIYLNNQFAEIHLQYKKPHTDSIQILHYPLIYHPEKFEKIDAEYRFAAAIALFGQVLKKSKFVQTASLDQTLALAKSSANEQEALQKEMIGLIEKAIQIYTPPKKKKNQSKKN